MDFHTVTGAAARRGETAIGYRRVAHSDDPGRGFGVTGNPTKSQRVGFSEHDKIIVLAEDRPARCMAAACSAGPVAVRKASAGGIDSHLEYWREFRCR